MTKNKPRPDKSSDAGEVHSPTSPIPAGISDEEIVKEFDAIRLHTVGWRPAAIRLYREAQENERKKWDEKGAGTDKSDNSPTQTGYSEKSPAPSKPVFSEALSSCDSTSHPKSCCFSSEDVEKVEHYIKNEVIQKGFRGTNWVGLQLRRDNRSSRTRKDAVCPEVNN